MTTTNLTSDERARSRQRYLKRRVAAYANGDPCSIPVVLRELRAAVSLLDSQAPSGSLKDDDELVAEMNEAAETLVRDWYCESQHRDELVDEIAVTLTAAHRRAEANAATRMRDKCVTANWDPEKRNTFAEEIAHLHEELSEAFRAWRKYKDCEVREVNGRLEGVPVELADALIGMFYNAELHGFDLLAAVERKHQFNLSRNYVAEGRQLHPPTAPVAPSPGEPRLCLKCGHDDRTDLRGRCIAVYRDPGGSLVYCDCTCRFDTAALRTSVEGASE